MDKDQISWLQVSASLLGGGAMGALISSAITAFRNRRQPVRYNISTYTLYGGTDPEDDVDVHVSINDGTNSYQFDNMHVIIVKFENKGGIDWNSMTLGVTLPDGHRIVRTKDEPSSRHHKGERITDLSPGSPRSEIDFELSPFNRGDWFESTLYVVTSDEDDEVGTVELTSPQAVRFVSAADWGDRFGALGSAISIGPLKVSVGFD